MDNKFPDKKYMIKHGKAEDILPTLPDRFVQTIITSPPYWQARDYFEAGQLGWEATPEEYADHLVAVFHEARRVLRDDGVLWLNIGDCYNTDAGFNRASEDWKRMGRTNGSAGRKAIKHPYIKRKELVGVPWTVAFAMRKDGWFLRGDIVWEKTNPMPDGAKDRPCHAHEYLFMFSKKPRYYYDYFNSNETASTTPSKVQRFGARNQKGTFRQDQDRTFEHYGSRNRRSVWRTAVSNFQGDHFATYPPELIYPCVVTSTPDAGCCAGCGTPYARDTEIIEKDEKTILNPTPWEKQCKCDTTERRPSIVLDPFSGMATTGMTALKNCRYYIGIELNAEWVKSSHERINTPYDSANRPISTIERFNND